MQADQNGERLPIEVGMDSAVAVSVHYLVASRTANDEAIGSALRRSNETTASYFALTS